MPRYGKSNSNEIDLLKNVLAGNIVQGYILQQCVIDAITQLLQRFKVFIQGRRKRTGRIINIGHENTN